MLATYLPSSDKVLLSSGSEVKLISRDLGGRSSFFEDGHSTYFGNRISELTDKVRLFIDQKELNWLKTHVHWDKHAASSIVTRLESYYDGNSLKLEFIDALMAVKALCASAVEVAAQWSENIHQLEQEELTLK